MKHLEELNHLIQEYVAFARTLKRESLVQKMFMDRRSNDSEHPAHMAFYEAVGQWARDFAASDPSQQELVPALERLLLTAQDYKDQMSYWYLLVVQGHAACLIPLLEDSARQHLLEIFEAQYPCREQLPVQKEIAGLLRGKTQEKKRKFLSSLFS